MNNFHGEVMHKSIYRGVSTNTTPFITSILAPQLKLRNLPLFFVETLDLLPDIEASYSLLDGELVLKQSLLTKQKLTSYLKTQATSIALTFEKSHRTKIELLNIGFHHCLEVPTSTEVIIKTIENNLIRDIPSSSKEYLRDAAIGYQAKTVMSYLHDKAGRHFLTFHRKSMYVSNCEQRLLEYFLQCNGFVSKTELAYAGWKQFDVRPNTVTVAIKKLRKKIAAIGLPYIIRNLYGYGYILEKHDSQY